MRSPALARCARALSLVSLLATAACDNAPLPPLVYSERIGSLARGYVKRSLVVSADERSMAWVQRKGDRCRVVRDRTRDPWLDQCTTPRISRDGETVAYWAAPELRGGTPFGYLFVNGQQVPRAVRSEGPIAFGPQGNGWAAIAAAFDPDAVPPAPPSPSPSPAAQAPGDAEEPTPGAPAPAAPRRVVALSSLGVLGDYHDTTAPAVSPDGRHVAFIAADADGGRQLIVDGEVARTFAKPEVKYLPVVKDDKPEPNLGPESQVRYFADGSLLVATLAEGGWTVLHGEEVWATYAAVRIPSTGFRVVDPSLMTRPAMLAGSFATAAEASTACWWERLEGDAEHWRVVCNGSPIDEHRCDLPSETAPLAVSADGRSVAYTCGETPEIPPDGSPALPRFRVVVGGEVQATHLFVWGLDLSADGRHYAYAAADSVEETWFYVVDGKRYDGPWRQAFPPKLSPDGATVVWAASHDEEGGKRVDLVFDGTPVARAEIVMAPPLFSGSRKVQWAVKRGNSVRRIVVCTRWAPLESLRRLACWW